MKILTKVMDLLALSVILSFMILMFSGCQMASGTLSEKEITVFNTEFFNGDITNMNNMLLSSEYSQPDEINLFYKRRMMVICLFLTRRQIKQVQTRKRGIL